MILNRKDYLQFILAEAAPHGYIAEFGVGRGNSMRVIAREVLPVRVHGFDSWAGLPEEWVYAENDRRAARSYAYRMPAKETVGANVDFHSGLFEDSIPVWLEKHPANMKFVHIDSDLYSSCKTVLTLLNDRIVPGTVLVFDEIYNYPNWKDGEYKALMEWKAEYKRLVTTVAHHNLSAAFKVLT